MSRYQLVANGRQSVWGVPWVEIGGTVAGGILSDDNDSTYLQSAASNANGGQQGVGWLAMSNQTIPANEAAYKVSCTVRAAAEFSDVVTQVLTSIRTKIAPFEQVTIGGLSSLPTTLKTTSSPPAGLGRFLDQSEVDELGIYLRRTSLTTTWLPPFYSESLWVYNATMTVYTTSLPRAPGIGSLGTVTGTSRPLIQWTHTDRTEAAVTNKASSGTTRTITTGAAHGFVVGQSVSVSIADVDYDTGAGVITSVTSTTFTYTMSGAKTQSTTSASGTAWIGEDKAQSNAIVLIVNSAQYSAPGFDPDLALLPTRPRVWSARITGYDQAVTPDIDLPNDTYRVYVRTASRPAGIVAWSPWAYVSMVVSTTPAPAPDLAPVWDGPGTFVALTVQGHANIVSASASTAESVDDWAADSNCSITASGTQKKSGANSIRLSSTASGTMSARTASTPVTAGKAYSATVAVRAGSVGRSSTVGIQWLDGAGSVLATTTGTAATSTTGGWAVLTASGSAPAGAVAARLLVTVAATGGAGELHYADEAGMFPTATFPAWTPGTGGATYSVTLERSLDAVTWAPLRVLPTDTLADAGGRLTDQDQMVVWYDHEAPRGALVHYRARVVATAGGVSIGSDPAEESAVTTLDDGRSWIKAVNNPLLNHGFRTLTVEGYSESHDTLAEVFRPGGDTFIVNHPGGGWDRTLRIITNSTAEKEAWVALAENADTVLVQMADTDSAGVGRQVYGSLVDTPTATPIAPGMWETTATLVETAP